MAANLVQVKAEPQLLLDGWVILTSGTKRRWCEIEDIVSWVEAFMLFAMVLTLFFPHRWWDLKVYKLQTAPSVHLLSVCQVSLADIQ